MRFLSAFLCRCAVHRPVSVPYFEREAPCRRCGTPLHRDRFGAWHPPEHFHHEIARSQFR